MKKIFALILAIVLCATFSLGQTKSDTPKKATKTTVAATKATSKECAGDAKCTGKDKACCEKMKKTADGKDCCAKMKTGNKKADCKDDCKKDEKKTDEQKKEKE
jgi:hypothetical protein